MTGWSDVKERPENINVFPNLQQFKKNDKLILPKANFSGLFLGKSI